MTDTAASDRDQSYHALLMEYASGCMDEAQALAIATHLVLSPAARRMVAHYEQIGGSLLHECCSPVALKADALECVMAKLEKAQAPAQPCGPKARRFTAELAAMPGCLDHYLETSTWQRAADGTDIIHIKTTCSGSRAELVRLSAERYFHHGAGGQIVLVLDGRMTLPGRMFHRGDMMVIERAMPSQLQAGQECGCVALVVRRSSSPLIGCCRV